MLETIENNAYSHSCICPCCGKRFLEILRKEFFIVKFVVSSYISEPLRMKR